MSSLFFTHTGVGKLSILNGKHSLDTTLLSRTSKK